MISWRPMLKGFIYYYADIAVMRTSSPIDQADNFTYVQRNPQASY